MEHSRGTSPQHNPFIWFRLTFAFRLISCSVLLVLCVGLSTWRSLGGCLFLLLFAVCSVTSCVRAGRWSCFPYNIFVLFDLRLATSDHSLAMHTPDSGFHSLSLTSSPPPLPHASAERCLQDMHQNPDMTHLAGERAGNASQGTISFGSP